MSMDEVKHRTERVDEAINEVITESDAGLAAVSRAVSDVNETLAVHAAWTEERFESVDDRLASLARIQVMASSKVEMQIVGIESHLRGFGVSLSAMMQTLSRLDQNQAALLQDHSAMVQRAERLEQHQEASRQELAMLVETMRGLTARVGEVLACAISDEMRQHTKRLAGLDEPADCEGSAARADIPS